MWQLILDIIESVLKFFKRKTVEQEETNVKASEDAKKHQGEIDEKVNKADDSTLTDIAIDSGLVQRPNGESGQPTSTDRTQKSRFKSGQHIIGEK
jgi:hypothetical protein